MNLDGRVVLITGTAGGMGVAAARLFAAAGATVVGCDIRPADCSEPVDLTDEEAVRRWVDAAAEAYGGIDVLFFPVKHAWRATSSGRARASSRATRRRT